MWCEVSNFRYSIIRGPVPTFHEQWKHSKLTRWVAQRTLCRKPPISVRCRSDKDYTKNKQINVLRKLGLRPGDAGIRGGKRSQAPLPHLLHHHLDPDRRTAQLSIVKHHRVVMLTGW